jgi:hypothetical protein
MAVANVEELCAGFCEIAGIQAPVLKPDERGLIAFHVKYRGVTVDVMHCPQRCSDRAFIIIGFGTLSLDDDEDAGWSRAMLRANFVTLQQPQGVFACNPATDEFVLQYTYPLFEATPHALLELVEQGTTAALQWRDQTAQAAQF